MLNSNQLYRIKNNVKNDLNLSDEGDIDIYIHYLIENLNGNLGVIEKNFTKNWNDGGDYLSEGREDILAKRISTLMIIDDLVENLTETIEKEIDRKKQ